MGERAQRAPMCLHLVPTHSPKHAHAMRSCSAGGLMHACPRSRLHPLACISLPALQGQWCPHQNRAASGLEALDGARPIPLALVAMQHRNARQARPESTEQQHGAEVREGGAHDTPTPCWGCSWAVLGFKAARHAVWGWAAPVAGRHARHRAKSPCVAPWHAQL